MNDRKYGIVDQIHTDDHPVGLVNQQRLVIARDQLGMSAFTCLDRRPRTEVGRRSRCRRRPAARPEPGCGPRGYWWCLGGLGGLGDLPAGEVVVAGPVHGVEYADEGAAEVAGVGSEVLAVEVDGAGSVPGRAGTPAPPQAPHSPRTPDTRGLSINNVSVNILLARRVKSHRPRLVLRQPPVHLLVGGALLPCLRHIRRRQATQPREPQVDGTVRGHCTPSILPDSEVSDSLISPVVWAMRSVMASASSAAFSGSPRTWL